MGQRPKATLSQTREEDLLQDGKFRTSCCPWIVVKFWYQFVCYITKARLVKFIFTSSTRAMRRSSTIKLARFTKKHSEQIKKTDNNRSTGDRLRDLPQWPEEEPGDRRNTCSRRNFSWLRPGTSYKIGSQEAQYLCSLPKRSKLGSMLANSDDKGSLQKTHWRSSASSRNV